MRILLTGCKGQLGLELMARFAGLGYETLATDLHNLDITDQSQVWSAVEGFRPEFVINCAAYTNVDQAESDEENAFRVNAVGARNLSVAAYRVKAGIAQVSTDYVFDGLNATAPLREYHPVNPVSCYGRSKELGERLVRETNPRHYIVRTAWLYGEGRNFVQTMLRLAKERSEIEVVADQIGTPTSVKDLAECLVSLLPTEGYGVYHATGEGACSWYDFAKRIFALVGAEVKVNPITSEEYKSPAKRPKYSVLENFMLKLIGLNTFRPWEEALEEYLRGRRL